MFAVDKSDITEIRKGRGEFDYTKRKNTGNRTKQLPNAEPKVHNPTFRESTFIKPAPEGRRLYGIDPLDTRMSVDAIVNRLGDKQYPMYELEKQGGVTQYDKYGNLIYVTDPKTGKRIAKMFNFTEIMRDVSLMAQLIGHSQERLRQGVQGQEADEIQQELTMIGMRLLGAMQQSTQREQFDVYYNAFMKIPQGLLDDQVLDTFANDLGNLENSQPGNVMLPNTTVPRMILERAPGFHRELASVLGNNSMAFADYLSQWRSRGPMEDINVMGQAVRDSYRRWWRGETLPLPGRPVLDQQLPAHMQGIIPAFGGPIAGGPGGPPVIGGPFAGGPGCPGGPGGPPPPPYGGVPPPPGMGLGYPGARVPPGIFGPAAGLPPLPPQGQPRQQQQQKKKTSTQPQANRPPKQQQQQPHRPPPHPRVSKQQRDRINTDPTRWMCDMCDSINTMNDARCFLCNYTSYGFAQNNPNQISAAQQQLEQQLASGDPSNNFNALMTGMMGAIQGDPNSLVPFVPQPPLGQLTVAQQQVNVPPLRDYKCTTCGFQNINNNSTCLVCGQMNPIRPGQRASRRQLALPGPVVPPVPASTAPSGVASVGTLPGSAVSNIPPAVQQPQNDDVINCSVCGQNYMGQRGISICPNCGGREAMRGYNFGDTAVDPVFNDGKTPCPKCKFRLDADNNQCPKCGTVVNPAGLQAEQDERQIKCRQCKNMVPVDTVVCPFCQGTRFARPISVPSHYTDDDDDIQRQSASPSHKQQQFLSPSSAKKSPAKKSSSSSAPIDEISPMISRGLTSIAASGLGVTTTELRQHQKPSGPGAQHQSDEKVQDQQTEPVAPEIEMQQPRHVIQIQEMAQPRPQDQHQDERMVIGVEYTGESGRILMNTKIWSLMNDNHHLAGNVFYKAQNAIMELRNPERNRTDMPVVDVQDINSARELMIKYGKFSNDPNRGLIVDLVEDQVIPIYEEYLAQRDTYWRQRGQYTRNEQYLRMDTLADNLTGADNAAIQTLAIKARDAIRMMTGRDHMVDMVSEDDIRLAMKAARSNNPAIQEMLVILKQYRSIFHPANRDTVHTEQPDTIPTQQQVQDVSPSQKKLVQPPPSTVRSDERSPEQQRIGPQPLPQAERAGSAPPAGAELDSEDTPPIAEVVKRRRALFQDLENLSPNDSLKQIMEPQAKRRRRAKSDEKKESAELEEYESAEETLPDDEEQVDEDHQTEVLKIRFNTFKSSMLFTNDRKDFLGNIRRLDADQISILWQRLLQSAHSLMWRAYTRNPWHTRLFNRMDFPQVFPNILSGDWQYLPTWQQITNDDPAKVYILWMYVLHMITEITGATVRDLDAMPGSHVRRILAMNTASEIDQLQAQIDFYSQQAKDVFSRPTPFGMSDEETAAYRDQLNSQVRDIQKRIKALGEKLAAAKQRALLKQRTATEAGFGDRPHKRFKIMQKQFEQLEISDEDQPIAASIKSKKSKKSMKREMDASSEENEDDDAKALEVPPAIVDVSQEQKKKKPTPPPAPTKKKKATEAEKAALKAKMARVGEALYMYRERAQNVDRNDPYQMALLNRYQTEINNRKREVIDLLKKQGQNSDVNWERAEQVLLRTAQQQYTSGGQPPDRSIERAFHKMYYAALKKEYGDAIVLGNEKLRELRRSKQKDRDELMTRYTQWQQDVRERYRQFLLQHVDDFTGVDEDWKRYHESALRATRKRRLDGTEPTDLVLGQYDEENREEKQKKKKSSPKGKKKKQSGKGWALNKLKSRPAKLNQFMADRGDSKVISVSVCRAPVQELPMKVLNALTAGGVNKLKRKMAYDDAYHLYMLLTLDNGEIWRFEKNQVVEIQKFSGVHGKGFECQQAHVNPVVFNDLVHAVEKKYGMRSLYLYQAWDNNCQKFVQSFLHTMGVTSLDSFVMQDWRGLFEKKYMRTLARKVTDASALFKRVFMGAGVE